MKNTKYLMILSALLTGVSTYAASPTQENYVEVTQGIMAQFDRDYRDLNPKGKPAPGAVATVETFLQIFNLLKISAAGEYHFFLPEDGSTTCSQASKSCQELKLLVQNSKHSKDSTLFGVVQPFTWDLILWSNSGSGFERFLQGFYTPVKGTPGKGNLMLISCGGCSVVGHAQIEWDGTKSVSRIRSHIFDAKMGFNDAGQEITSGVLLDGTYNPSTGDVKLAITGNGVCDGSNLGDSHCKPNGTSDHMGGYSAMLHGNNNSGNIYISGLHVAANSSSAVTGADGMCILPNHTADLSGAACIADGTADLSGILALPPVAAPLPFITAGNPWPLSEVTDTPSF